MKIITKRNKNSIIFILALCFFVQNVFNAHNSFANNALGLVQPLANVSANPIILQGIKLDSKNPLTIDFIAKYDLDRLEKPNISRIFNRQIRYFLAALTLPEQDLWVNFSPFEKNRIIPNTLSQTELGEIMLINDYFLKQVVSTFMSPDNEFGKNLWDKIYKKTYQEYGTTSISLDYFNKIWIVPKKSVVYQKDSMALILSSDLKVMLEKDYLAAQQIQKHKQSDDSNILNLQKEGEDLVSREIFKEIIIPEIENMVNNDKKFSSLRQIYHALILAKWYKDYFHTSDLYKMYVNKNKINGIDVIDQEFTKKIYKDYVSLFENGVKNIVRVEYDPYERKNVARRYFSGGILGEVRNKYVNNLTKFPSLKKNEEFIQGRYRFQPINNSAAASSNLNQKIPPKRVSHFFTENKKGTIYTRASYFSPEQVEIFSGYAFIQSKSERMNTRKSTKIMSPKDLELGLTVVETFTPDGQKKTEVFPLRMKCLNLKKLRKKYLSIKQKKSSFPRKSPKISFITLFADQNLFIFLLMKIILKIFS